MFTVLNQKNNFVISLREHLKSIYNTRYHYTFGESDFEYQKIDKGYSLIDRDPNKPRNISGFYFRKDLCSWLPQNATEVLKEIHDFASKDKNLESVLREDKKDLKITFGDKDYLVTSYINNSYAGNIVVWFRNPYFEKIL